MDRAYYLQLAQSGLSMPVGTDLILHTHADTAEILSNGERLGRVLEETARHFATPLALPHMDLELEKFDLLTLLGVPQAAQAQYHFTDCLDEETITALRAQADAPFLPHLQAHIDSIRYIATQATDLLPVGMAIGPFSLMTKLLSDPITPLCLAGSGLTAEDDDEIKLVEQCLELAVWTIERSITAQIAAGARAIFIAEPAANVVFISPNQMAAGSDIFDRYVMRYDQQIRDVMRRHGVDLLFHDCGELTDEMVSKFTELDPAIMSLGSSRVLWEDARLVPDSTVLFGNLPSKRFYSDALITAEQVREMGETLIRRMREVGHPFILASECDVLSVPGCQDTIMAKAKALQNVCGCGCGVTTAR